HDLTGDLNLDAGDGRHQLMISDAQSELADADVRITEATNLEVQISGLAPAAIRYGASADGHFADGITYWAGRGDDAITVEAIQRRVGLVESANGLPIRTTTTLHAGPGADQVILSVADDTADPGLWPNLMIVNAEGGDDTVNAAGVAADGTNDAMEATSL